MASQAPACALLLLGSVLIVLPLPTHGRQAVACAGQYKSFFVVFHLPDYDSPAALPLPTDWGAVYNRLRLQLSWQHSDWLVLHAAYDLSPRVQDPVLFENRLTPTGIDPAKYRAVDLRARLHPGRDSEVGSFAIFQNLDRMLVELKTAPADILIGRQPIAWGSSRVLNPTDVLTPFVFQELDTEERVGIDAVRVRVPLSALAEFDAGYVFGENFAFTQSAFFTRAKFYRAKTDVALLLLGFRGNLLVGIDLARSLGGAGLWLEAAQVFTDRLQESAGEAAPDYFRGTAGLDYSFSGGTYGFVEYHYSTAGAGNAEHYLRSLTAPAFQEGAVYLLGRHYLAPGLVFQISPLLTLSTQALCNLNDASLFLAAQWEYNLAQNVYLAAGAFFSSGKRPEITSYDAVFPTLRLHSEFGTYPDLYFTAIRIYF
ncbi:MAG: hypothetical protein ONB48_16370 [candidate division KSB1 bacterium]|nr:hypothetical protein [candidate division KSB1 bacterium]MDZ7274253.1 hypothetical protein [candidate division KSB1 bacterium]MDZ7287225.1 hypothetical protein [candidate division KSB1 bacterium]MDZ7296851.1 hypothetical protein [candidate division KSB1 bacterium]MDZ7306045.1 hypothetical protein [candidate division KSB1 bacterium]